MINKNKIARTETMPREREIVKQVQKWHWLEGTQLKTNMLIN